MLTGDRDSCTFIACTVVKLSLIYSNYDYVKSRQYRRCNSVTRSFITSHGWQRKRKEIETYIYTWIKYMKDTHAQNKENHNPIKIWPTFTILKIWFHEWETVPHTHITHSSLPYAGLGSSAPKCTGLYCRSEIISSTTSIYSGLWSRTVIKNGKIPQRFHVFTPTTWTDMTETGIPNCSNFAVIRFTQN